MDRRDEGNEGQDSVRHERYTTVAKGINSHKI